MIDAPDLQRFDQARPKLLGLAYRILGSRADAEDAVQDAFVKWAAAERSAIQNPDAWLRAVCARRCLDMLRAADRKRVDYVGAWLPEPLHMAVDDASAGAELAESLTTAFLLLLDRLTAKERAAYLLREIFDAPYPEIAAALELSEPACRKLVSRAKKAVDDRASTRPPPPERQERLLSAFMDAVSSGQTEALAALLSEDVRLTVDSGGKVPAIREVMVGLDQVATFIGARLSVFWRGARREQAVINGGLGLTVAKEGAPTAVVTFGYGPDGRVRDVFIMRNPDKLTTAGAVAVQ